MDITGIALLCVILGVIIYAIVCLFSDDTNDNKNQIEIEEIVKRRDAAEVFVMNSGDEDAIKILAQIKSSPGTFKDEIKVAAKNNEIIRVALGVIIGAIKFDLIGENVSVGPLDSVLAEFDSQLEVVGGIDNIEMPEGIIPESTVIPGIATAGISIIGRR